MATNICQRCVLTFESKGKKAFCENCRVGHCVICGKEFIRVGGDPERECCSRVCAGKYREITGIGKEFAKKSQKTKIDKYGSVSGPVQVFNKICKYCVKEFETTSARQQYCSRSHDL